MIEPPGTGRAGRFHRRLLIVGVACAITVALVAALVATVVSHGTHDSIVSSSSTDGTFIAGNCVSLSATRATKVDCGGAHDALIVQVIHSPQACAAGTVEFEVTDGTGSLCLDKSNNARS